MLETLGEAAAAVRAGAVSPRELVEASLAAIERVQLRLNAFTTVLGEQAMARAGALTGVEPAGPLHGVPIVVKDLYDVAGARTTGCCAAYLERPPASRDAFAIARLVAAGAIVVAKTNQHELACGATNLVSCFGPVRNPWDEARIPGGSSGGSAAAVATRVVTMAMGSDTGGSIRIPAAMCGVTGLKPTHGAVSLSGAMPMVPGFDSGGPLAVSAEDCALVHRILTGYDDDYLFSRAAPEAVDPPPMRGLRVGLPRNMFTLLHPQVRAAVEAAADVLRGRGAVLVELDGPRPEDGAAVWVARYAEVANCYRDLWDDERVSPPIRNLINLGRGVTGPDLAHAGEVTRRMRRDFELALSQVDVLLTPTTAYPPPRADEEEVAVDGGTVDVHRGGATRLTAPVNLAGLPALSIPVGFVEGLPVGAQLIGREWSEASLCAIGANYQAETRFHLSAAPDH